MATGSFKDIHIHVVRRKRLAAKGFSDQVPQSWGRWAMRLPIWLYRLHLGWLLGKRFVLLTHIGRKTGKPRHAVLEVLRYDKANDTYILASAWGEHADWFRNVLKTPEVGIQVGRRRLNVTAERLPIADAAREFFDYAQHHRFAFHKLTQMLLGLELAGSEEDCLSLAQSIPLVALRPKNQKG